MLDVIGKRFDEVAEHSAFTSWEKRFDGHARDEYLATEALCFFFGNGHNHAIEPDTALFIDDACGRDLADVPKSSGVVRALKAGNRNVAPWPTWTSSIETGST